MLEIKIRKSKKRLIIDNKETDYEIDKNGNIYRLGDINPIKPNTCKTTGYCHISLAYTKKSNKRKYHSNLVHRLVAINFIPNPDNKKCVNHKDGNKRNNSVDNLEWVSCSENMKHAKKYGLWNPDGENNGNSRYSDKQIEEVCKLLQTKKYKNKEISLMTDVSPEMVSMIKIGKVRNKQSEKYHWDTIPFSDRKGEKHSQAKITEKDVHKICLLLSKNILVKDIVSKLSIKNKNITKAMVNNIKYRKCWKEISDNYVF